MSRTSLKPIKRNDDGDDESDSNSDSDSDNDGLIDDTSSKSDSEAELERLVFGDKVGFRSELTSFSPQDDQDDEAGLEGLDDNELFFTDLTPADGAAEPSAVTTEEHISCRGPPAWEDSDDERMMVSLASKPQLRKLRRFEGEDIITVAEYQRRLRQEYERLNPTPEWALYAMKHPPNKRRKLSHDGDRSDSDLSGEEMNLDDDVPTVAPLAKLLQSSESLVRETGKGVGKKRKLRSETIDIKRQKDIDLVQPSAITSLSFHPTLPLLLSSGPSSTMYLHHLSRSPTAPTENPLLTSLHLRGCHLTTTAFHPSDSRIFLSSRRRYFHVWNLTTGRIEKISRIAGHEHEQRSMEIFKLSPDGKYMALQGTSKKNTGTVNILDATTLQWTSLVRIDGRGGVADFAWWRDGNGMSVVNKDGEVTEWDVENQKLVTRWQVRGAVGTTTISLGGRHGYQRAAIGMDRWVAVGSSSGVVNIYDRQEWLSSATGKVTDPDAETVPSDPEPTRSLDHLTTPVTQLIFSPDGQVLAMGSKWSRDALKLVHLPSCTVFKNWPTSKTPLGRITGVAFAGGEVVEGEDDLHSVLAVANEQGKIRLWHIR